MDFIIVLPRIAKNNYRAMEVMDKLRKVSHFILVKYTYKEVNIVNAFMNEILW